MIPCADIRRIEGIVQQQIFHPQVLVAFLNGALMACCGMDETQIRERMARLGIQEDDLEEAFVRGTGAGGQKINKTSSTVVLRHGPTGLEVRCQRERSQSLNRLIARSELCDKMEGRIQAARLEKKAAVEKKKRQNRPRPRGLKERILQGKKHRSEVKRQRTKPSE